MNPIPAILLLSQSGVATAMRIKKALGRAEIHGLRSRVAGVDVAFDDVAGHLRSCFADQRPLIGVCASGILVRALAPVLNDKREEPPVIAVADDGSAVVPLLGGHRGGNALARAVGAALDIRPAITTAGDVRLGRGLDDPPAGWTLSNPGAAKNVMASALAGQGLSIDPQLTWLSDAPFNRQEAAAYRLTASVYRREAAANELLYHPRKVIIGVGSDRGCPSADLIALVDDVLSRAGIARPAIACVVSLDRKADETAVHDLAEHLGVSARFLTADEINVVADRIPNPSAIVAREVGVPGVAEGTALAASGAATLVVEKTKTQHATCAVAVSNEIVEPHMIGRARGHLAIVGIGPGSAAWRSAEATALLQRSDDWVGYGLYLDLIEDLKSGQVEHRYPLGAEEDRVRHALELAGTGRRVALICSGDAGIYAMAALAFELLGLGAERDGVSDAARRVDVAVAPGISAVQAAAARAGAPIGHDFCCISLSDLLTPWPVIERRVQAAADGDFVVAFYNPRSLRRRDQLDRAIAILRSKRPFHTPVIIASNLGRADETHHVVTLDAFEARNVDMLSIVIVGASTTEQFRNGEGRTLVFTPRGYAAKREAAE